MAESVISTAVQFDWVDFRIKNLLEFKQIKENMRQPSIASEDESRYLFSETKHQEDICK